MSWLWGSKPAPEQEVAKQETVAVSMLDTARSTEDQITMIGVKSAHLRHKCTGLTASARRAMLLRTPAGRSEASALLKKKAVMQSTITTNDALVARLQQAAQAIESVSTSKAVMGALQQGTAGMKDALDSMCAVDAEDVASNLEEVTGMAAEMAEALGFHADPDADAAGQAEIEAELEEMEDVMALELPSVYGVHGGGPPSSPPPPQLRSERQNGQKAGGGAGVAIAGGENA